MDEHFDDYLYCCFVQFANRRGAFYNEIPILYVVIIFLDVNYLMEEDNFSRSEC